MITQTHTINFNLVEDQGRDGGYQHFEDGKGVFHEADDYVDIYIKHKIRERKVRTLTEN